MNKKVFLSTIISTLIFAFAITNVYSKKLKKPEKIQKAKVYSIENKYITRFINFCNTKGIKAKAMPIKIGGRRSFFVYIVNKPHMDNFLVAVKLVSARYLLPLLRNLVKTKNNQIGYNSLLIYLRGRNKVLTSAIMPKDAILFTAGRINKKTFYKRVIVSYTKP
jgi:hypothetical protein